MNQAENLVGNSQDGDYFWWLVEEVVRAWRLPSWFDNGRITAALV